MENQTVDTLLQTLPYILRHRGATFVIKFGGELAREQTTLDNLALDIALCTNVGIRIVAVHGGGPQATELGRKLGIEPVIIDGRRVTDDATLDVTKMAFAGLVNIDILSALRRRQIKAVGLSGVDAGIINAVKRPVREVRNEQTGETRSIDYGLVGDIVSIDTGILQLLVNNGCLPVITCLGGDNDGHVFNINADTVAAELAKKLNADKLISLTDVPGILRNAADPSSLISHISAQMCEDYIKQGVISAGMIPKVQALIGAIRGGVKRVHILNGIAPHNLLVELFTKEGAGTMITSSDEESRYINE